MRMAKALSIALISVLALSLGPGTGSLYGQLPQTGFPSLDTNDGKFVALAGTGLSTVAQPVSFWIGLPADQGSFTLDLFDADLGGFWDVHDTSRTVRVSYVLYADPLKNGSGSTALATKTAADFSDDAWGTMYSGTVHAAARAPSGNLFYRLQVSFADPTAAANELNGFKIRADGQVGLIPGTFGFVGALINVDVLSGKADPALGTARNKYDGEWHWYVYAPSAGTAVTLADTDADSRTSLTRPGNPPDDCSSGATCFAVAPDVRYQVLDAAGSSLITVTAPSGDLETATRSVTASQAGFLDWNWTGVDGHNLVFISSSHEVFASSAQTPLGVGAPSPGPGPGEKSFHSTIKGRVYADGNCNGRPDAGEDGIGGVVVTIDSGGGWSARTSTGADGRYEFAALSEGRFSLTAALPAGYARAAPSTHEGIAVDGEVTTIVEGKDFGIATASACAEASKAVPSQPLAPAPWPPQGPSRAWYLAEGCACPPFDTSFLITNPNEAEATITARFMKEEGAVLDLQYLVPARSRLSVPAPPEAAGAAFSTVIDSDRPVFAQRSVSMARTGRLTSGVTAPSRTWFMAEGRTGAGFDTWLLMSNPGAQPARATITFFVENGRPVELSYDLLPTSRFSLYVNPVLSDAAFGARVEASQPIVVERAMYFAEGGSHGAMGSTLASNIWYLPDVDTRPDADSWILIANPNAQASSLTLAFVTDGGATVKGSYSVPASSRLTLYANDIMPRVSGFATVQADLPIVVERSAYWMGGRASYSSPGVPATARSWSFAQAGPPAPSQELLLVVNQGATQATVIVSFLLENGDTLGNTYNVAPSSRLVLDPKAVAPRQALTMNLESDAPVIAERLAYSSR